VTSGLEATFVPGSSPALAFWLRPDEATPLPEAVAAVLGEARGRQARLPLAWPAAWATGGSASARGLETAEVDALALPVGEATAPLARLPAGGDGRRWSASLAGWSLAAKLALELVARHRVAPWAEPPPDAQALRWRAAPDPDDMPRLDRLAAALPPAARSCAGTERAPGPPRLLHESDALRAFLDAAADALVRAEARPAADRGEEWSQRVAAALTGRAGALRLRPLVDDPLVEALRQWTAPTAGGVAGPVQLVLRLAAPDDDEGPWTVHLAAASTDEASLQLDADEVWRVRSESLIPGLGAAALRGAFLAELGRAARIWPRLGQGLRGRRPASVPLAVEEAVDLLLNAAPLLRAAGVEVRVPAELTAAGRRRLRARLKGRTTSRASGGDAGFGLDAVATVHWEAMLDDSPLTPRELERLARLKQPLVRLRGQWALLDRSEVEEVARRLREGEWQLEGGAALATALADEDRLDLAPGDPLETLRAALRSPAADLGEVPGLECRLRPYQRHGAAWLERLDAAGLGGVLADDMGLGKTVQVLAFLLRRAAVRPPLLPHLLVCPTSVLGAWEREVARFAPSLPLYRHYGPDRAGSRRALAAAAAPGTLCLTTYGLLRRDRKLLSAERWETVVLDEAQAVKNPDSQVARAACAVPAATRFALTGTPVENRLTDLWSLFRFAVPGLLGPEQRFAAEIATPVERYRSRPALERLHRLTGPFLLRRSKTDPAILPDLPPRLVVRVACPLTPEQATLYRAAVDEAMEQIREAEGVDRRGRVLALVTLLKQVCNHPEQVLGGAGRLGGRSGKLDRLGDELEEVLAAGEAALVFTQYRTMGDLLVRHLAERLGVRAPFLHGGVPQVERARMVDRFQESDGPPLMVISLRAGGTGLTLTRASHVFHFDRWWNPAVENQATDRAFRIGQTRNVMVHKFICAGTMEERIDEMIERKKDVAEQVVGTGEGWLTELSNEELREVFSLRKEEVAD